MFLVETAGHEALYGAGPVPAGDTGGLMYVEAQKRLRGTRISTLIQPPPGSRRELRTKTFFSEQSGVFD